MAQAKGALSDFYALEFAPTVVECLPTEDTTLVLQAVEEVQERVDERGNRVEAMLQGKLCPSDKELTVKQFYNLNLLRGDQIRAANRDVKPLLKKYGDSKLPAAMFADWMEHLKDGEPTQPAPRPSSTEPPAKKTKEEELQDLDLASFIRFAAAMGCDIMQHLGLLPEGENLALSELPERVRDRFTSQLRCSFTWCADRTSMLLAADDERLLGLGVRPACMHHARDNDRT